MSRRNTIREVLDVPRYRSLFAEARRRYEDTGGSARTMTLHDLSYDERQAIADLFGYRTVPDNPVRIPLDKLDTELRTSRIGASLKEVLEALGGPLTNLKQQKEDQRRAREELWDQAREHRAILDRPSLERWLDEIKGQGLLTRASMASGQDPAGLLQSALRIIEQLPAKGMLLPVLAVNATGDAHALDPGRPLSGLLMRAVRHLTGQTSAPDTSSQRRMLWSQVGVLCDPLSSSTLILGLRSLNDSSLSRKLREAADEGEPQVLTLRELERDSLSIEPGIRVFVCENPGIVATAADRLGRSCAPLICTSGVPSTATTLLLESCNACNADIRFHCDFDWGGIRIGNLLHERFSAGPWRFTADEYRTAILRDASYPKLMGSPAFASWDPDLEAEMHRSLKVIMEEHVVEDLLIDLEGPASRIAHDSRHQ